MSGTPTKMVLTTARKLIEKEKDWIQFEWKSETRAKTKRCAYQAVEDAALMLGLDPERSLVLLARQIDAGGRNPREAIPEFNDTFRHKDVLALFDKALEQV